MRGARRVLQMPDGTRLTERDQAIYIYTHHYIASAACSSLSCASSSSSSTVCRRVAVGIFVRCIRFAKMYKGLTVSDCAGPCRVVDWYMLCPHQPLVQLILFQLIQLLYQCILFWRII